MVVHLSECSILDLVFSSDLHLQINTGFIVEVVVPSKILCTSGVYVGSWQDSQMPDTQRRCEVQVAKLCYNHLQSLETSDLKDGTRYNALARRPGLMLLRSETAGRWYEGGYLGDRKSGEGKFSWPDGPQAQSDLHPLKDILRSMLNDCNCKQPCLHSALLTDGFSLHDVTCLVASKGRCYVGQWLEGKQHGTGILAFRKTACFRTFRTLRWVSLESSLESSLVCSSG